MLNEKLIFVTGKGGTGKSTVSLRMARQLALQGKRVLLVELGEASSIKYLANLQENVGYSPVATPYGFDWSLLRGIDCLVDYVSSVIKVEKLTKYFFDNPFMKTLLEIAPGLDDLAILGKLTSHMRNHGPGFQYDHIIVDSHSTGSFKSMVMAPKLLSKMVTGGPLYSQSRQIDKTLMDGQGVHTIFVGLFEELPVDELLESLVVFKESFNSNYSVVMNKVLPDISITDKSSSWFKYINKKYSKQSDLKALLAQDLRAVSYTHLEPTRRS